MRNEDPVDGGEVGQHPSMQFSVPTLEVCVDSLVSASNAMKGGADRLEICSDLSQGGLSPSMELLDLVFEHRKELGCEDKVALHAMVRPRGGDFQYSEEEKRIIMSEIQQYADSKRVQGVVLGATLRNQGDHTTVSLDEEFSSDACICAKTLGLHVTFHRAFDTISDKYAALRTLASFGGAVQRVLTTGGPWATAYAGIAELRKLDQFCRNDLGGAISIMPGSGVTLDNAKSIVQATGVSEIHGSFQGDMDTIQSVKVSLLQRNK